MAQEIHIRE